MGQKKCSKVGISFGGLYMVIWGSTTKKLNRASAQMDFTEFSWLVSFWSGGGLFPIEYVCLNIKKNMICPLKMAENSVFQSPSHEESIRNGLKMLQTLLHIEKLLQRWIPFQMIYHANWKKAALVTTPVYGRKE